MNDKNILAEPIRIRNIQRRLSTINEFYRNNNEKIIANNSPHSNLLKSVPNRSPFNKRFHVRRQSTFD
jgi:hypothetical protein